MRQRDGDTVPDTDSPPLFLISSDLSALYGGKPRHGIYIQGWACLHTHRWGSERTGQSREEQHLIDHSEQPPPSLWRTAGTLWLGLSQSFWRSCQREFNSSHLSEDIYWERNALDICALQINSLQKGLSVPRNSSIRNPYLSEKVPKELASIISWQSASSSHFLVGIGQGCYFLHPSSF